MAGKQVQRRKGSTAETAVFTGALAETTVDTTKKTVVVHDGVTPGGFPLARASDVAATNANVTAAQNAADAAQTTANTGVANAATADAKAVVADGKAVTAQAEVDALEVVVSDLTAHTVPRDTTTGAATIPTGTNAQRPGAPVEGLFRFNSQLTRFEGYQNGQWAQVGGDSLPVFFTTWWPNRAAVPAGFVVADGQLLNRATYPDASTGIIAGNVPTATDADWLGIPTERGKYTLGNGTSTFRMPDYNGKFAGSLGAVFQRGDGTGSAGTNGVIQPDAFQGHNHSLSSTVSASSTGGTVQGVASGGSNTGQTISLLSDGTSGTPRFSAETRPLNVTGCWVIKLFGAVINPGAVDAAQLASDMANLTATAYQRSNILGAVSQTAGVPTGALMDTGSNANGTYAKYADGRLECTFYVASVSVAVTTNYGPIYYGQPPAWTFPVAFVGSPPYVGLSPYSFGKLVWSTKSLTISMSSAQFAMLDIVSATTAHQLSYVAIGRWY